MGTVRVVNDAAHKGMYEVSEGFGAGKACRSFEDFVALRLAVQSTLRGRLPFPRPETPTLCESSDRLKGLRRWLEAVVVQRPTLGGEARVALDSFLASGAFPGNVRLGRGSGDDTIALALARADIGRAESPAESMPAYDSAVDAYDATEEMTVRFVKYDASRSPSGSPTRPRANSLGASPSGPRSLYVPNRPRERTPGAFSSLRTSPQAPAVSVLKGVDASSGPTEATDPRAEDRASRGAAAAAATGRRETLESAVAARAADVLDLLNAGSGDGASADAEAHLWREIAREDPAWDAPRTPLVKKRLLSPSHCRADSSTDDDDDKHALRLELDRARAQNAVSEATCAALRRDLQTRRPSESVSRRDSRTDAERRRHLLVNDAFNKGSPGELVGVSSTNSVTSLERDQASAARDREPSCWDSNEPPARDSEPPCQCCPGWAPSLAAISVRDTPLRRYLQRPS